MEKGSFVPWGDGSPGSASRRVLPASTSRVGYAPGSIGFFFFSLFFRGSGLARASTSVEGRGTMELIIASMSSSGQTLEKPHEPGNAQPSSTTLHPGLSGSFRFLWRIFLKNNKIGLACLNFRFCAPSSFSSSGRPAARSGEMEV